MTNTFVIIFLALCVISAFMDAYKRFIKKSDKKWRVQTERIQKGPRNPVRTIMSDPVWQKAIEEENEQTR